MNNYYEKYKSEIKEQRVPSESSKMGFVETFKPEYKPLIKYLMDSIDNITFDEINNHIIECFENLKKNVFFTIYVNRIIQSAIYFTHKLFYQQNALDTFSQTIDLSQKGKYATYNNGNSIIKFIDKRLDNDQDKIIANFSNEYKTKLDEFMEIYSTTESNVLKKFFKKYGKNPMVVLDHKVPDLISLNPLYFAFIPNEFKQENVQLNRAKKDESNYNNLLGDYLKYPIWNNYEQKGYKMKNKNFKQPWYKDIKVNHINERNYKY